MYLDHYGLTELPFTTTPNPRFAYPSMSSRLASGKMRFAIQHAAGLALTLGPSGAGKSTLLQALLSTYGNDPTKTVAHLPAFAERGRAAAVKSIMGAYGQPATTRRSYTDNMKHLQSFLVSEASAGRHCVLLVDEAQTIHPDILDVISDLINFRTAETTFVTAVLFGLPSFTNKLRLPSLDSFRSRIAYACNLEPLGPDETAAMIAHRLRVAGADIEDSVASGRTPDISRWFSPDAITAIYAATKGTPRDVCVLCATSLLEAYILGEDAVTAEVVQHTVDSLKVVKRWPVPDNVTNEELDKQLAAGGLS